MYNGYQERRRFKRLKAKFIVYFKVDKSLEGCITFEDKETNALMIDIGEGGVAITTNYDIPVSTTLSIEFTLMNNNAYIENDRTAVIKVAGKVGNGGSINEKERRLGIIFLDIREAEKEAIANLVKMYKS